MENQSIRFLITGSQGAGKTSFCAGLIEAARAAGWQVAGLLSPALFEGDLRTQIQVQDLSNDETRILATRSDTPSPGSRHWRFDPEAVEWANGVLRNSPPRDLLVIDELGPLEFDLEQGWQSAFAVVDGRQYAIALIVVRPEYLPQALLRWDDVEIVEIDTPEDTERKLARLTKDLFGE